MTRFVASYTNSRGRLASIDVDAADAIQAKRKLRQRGIRAIEIKSKSGPLSANGETSSQQPAANAYPLAYASFLEAKPGVKQKAVFASKMAALVNAGVPIVRSIDLMASQQKIAVVQTGSRSGEPGRESGPRPGAKHYAAGPRCLIDSPLPWWKPEKQEGYWMNPSADWQNYWKITPNCKTK
jgi:hypothetical protein